MLIETCWRPWVDEEHSRILSGKIRCVVDEVMDLSDTIWALVPWNPRRTTKTSLWPCCSFDMRTAFPVGVDRVKSGALAPTVGSPRMPAIRKTEYSEE